MKSDLVLRLGLSLFLTVVIGGTLIVCIRGTLEEASFWFPFATGVSLFLMLIVLMMRMPWKRKMKG